MSIWHSRLLDVVKELGEPTMADVRRRFVELYGETFADYDKAIVDGTTHWYRKVLWARNDLVKEGKLAQQGDKLFIPQPKVDVYYPFSFGPFPEPFPMIDFKWTVAIHVFILILVVLLILNGGK